MLEELLGDSLSYIVRLLPIEITAIIIIMLVLHKTGSLERMSKVINLWIMSFTNAEEARKKFRQEVEALELAHDDKLETLQVEAQLQSRASYELENQRLREQLFKANEEKYAAHVSFLEKLAIKQCDFLIEIAGNNIRSKKDEIERNTKYYPQ